MADRKGAKKAATKALPFASLMGIRAEDGGDNKPAEETQDEKQARWAKLAEEDPDREQAEGESDEDYAARMEEMDNDEQASRAEGGDDGDNPDEKKDDEAKAVKAERARCAKIVAHGLKNNCAFQAATLAFDTGLSANEAIATMKASQLDGRAAGGGLGSRMATVATPSLGSGSQAQNNSGKSRDQLAAESIVKAAAAARGEKL